VGGKGSEGEPAGEGHLPDAVLQLCTGLATQYAACLGHAMCRRWNRWSRT